jgi:hypothetical protein
MWSARRPRGLVRRGVAGVALTALLGPAGCVSTAPPPRPTTGDMAGVRRLAVVVPAPGDLEVYQSRAKGAPAAGAGATIAAAAAFGVVGALVAGATVSAVVKDADDKRTAQVKPHVADFSARARFVKSLVETLRAGGRFEEIEALETPPAGAAAARFDAVATARIGDWGLHLLPNREDEALAGYAEVELRLVIGRQGRVVWDERRAISGPGRRPLGDYVADGELLRRELAETLEMAGERVAGELLYPREDKR